MIGLCVSCRFVRVVSGRAGACFYLCERSKLDPAYPKYPRLPVLRCAGFESRPADEATKESE